MTTTREPVVQRVAGWSVRHRKTAVIGWLLLVVAAVVIGQRAGTSNVQSYDPGQAGKAERALNEPAVQQPDSESVLIPGQAGPDPGHRPGYAPRGHRRCRGPAPGAALGH